ncbi:MAG TPA: hypothetical protein VGL66_00090 [Caulobacteraceae bacterium]
MLFDPGSDVATYLRQAVQCEQAARKCANLGNREAYLKLARQWRTLARDAGIAFNPSFTAADNDCDAAPRRNEA